MAKNPLSDKNKKNIYAKDNFVSRRDFMQFGLLTGTAFLFWPNLILRGQDCGPTSSDILGPYYVNDAPVRQILIDENEPGERMIISGTIYGDDCTTPVEGAIIDSWSADDSGCYSAIGPCASPGEMDRNLRGKMITGPDGKFEFEIVKPGFYLNGSSYRPSHVHYRVVGPDESVFITQLYFEGDPYIADDPWASLPEAAERIIPLTENGEKLYGQFDIKLNVNVSTGLDDDHLLPDQSHLYQNYPNPFNGSTVIRYSLHEQARIDLSIHDRTGKLIKYLDAGRKGQGYHRTVWDGTNERDQKVSSGMYIYRLMINSGTGKYVLSNRLLFIK